MNETIEVKMDGLSNTVINSRRQTSGYSHSSHPLPHGTCLVGVTKRKYDSFFFFTFPCSVSEGNLIPGRGDTGF